MKMKFWLLAALLASLAPVVSAQSLLPNGQQQFTDQNGQPLSGGTVYFYAPATTTPKFTYQNAALTVPNTNPVVLNSAGRAVIWGSGQFREIVYDQYGNLVWDQITAGSQVTFNQTYGVDTGTTNAMVVNIPLAPTAMSQLVGLPVYVKVASSSTSATPTLNVQGLGAFVVDNYGVGVLPIGVFTAGSIITVVWDGTQFQYAGPFSPATKAQLETGTDNIHQVTSLGLAQYLPGNHAVGGTINGGYQYLPGGAIIQWGYSDTTGTTPVTVTFPIAFTAVPSVTIGTVENAAGAAANPYFVIIDPALRLTTSFTAIGTVWIAPNFAPAAAGFRFTWQAVGQAALP